MAIALIHVVLAPSHIEEQPYIGALFSIGGGVLVPAAADLFWEVTRPIAWSSFSPSQRRCVPARPHPYTLRAATEHAVKCFYRTDRRQ